MISFTRYISIDSGVGGTSQVAFRDLIGRLFTTNELLPTGTIREFGSADDVGDYFGTDSTEYKRAAKYFGWTSKVITRAKKISFARWADAATYPQIFGVVANYALASFTSISTGSLRLTLGATTVDLTGMDFTGDLSLADVAATIQAKINAQAGTMWTAATVSYNATAKRFEFTGGDAGAAVVVTANVGSGTAIRSLIGWGTGAILSDGAVIQTITTVLADSTELNNNFGSFLFVDALSADEVEEAAIWNDTQNNMFMFCQRTSADDATDLSAAIIGYSGAGLMLDLGYDGEYPDQNPMQILAATNYSKPAAASNYEFQQFPDQTATVDTNADANTYDALRVNYVGQTQTAGVALEFFQQGYLMGGANDAVDMGVYANEQWFKDACAVTIMNLLLAVQQVPASSGGVGMILTVLQDVIDQALDNGTILPGKTLDVVQKVYIGTVTNDQSAWKQIQSLGYWVYAEIESYVESSITKYKCSYTIVYAKADSVRKVEGRDIMI